MIINNFGIADFMLGTGSLAQYNYIYVVDNDENIKKLKEMGCSDKEIQDMRCESDEGYLDIYKVLLRNGLIEEGKFL